MHFLGDHSNEDYGSSRYAVLVVDDEPSILQAFRRIFRREKFRLLCAGSAEEGLQLLVEAPQVAVIISDQRMPNMSGSDFLARCREIAPAATRILLTGCLDFDSTAAVEKRGSIFGLITKPWDDATLLQQVGEAVKRYHLVVERQYASGNCPGRLEGEQSVQIGEQYKGSAP